MNELKLITIFIILIIMIAAGPSFASLRDSQGMSIEDFEQELDTICFEYKQGTFTTTDAQSMIDDITKAIGAYEATVDEICN